MADDPMGWLDPPAICVWIDKPPHVVRITSVHKAAEILQYQWPADHRDGPLYKAALKACLNVHDSHTKREALRAALTAAAREASILRKDHRPS